MNPDGDDVQAGGDEPIERLAQDARVEHWPRLTGEPAEGGQEDAALENVRRWLEHEKVSIRQLARMAGLSPTMLSEALAGKYKGDTQAVLRNAEAAINQSCAQGDAPVGPQFVMTRIAREIFAVVKAASKHEGIGVITGPSGIGKSLSLQAVVKRDFPSAILTEVNAGCCSPLYFMRLVLQRERRGGRSGRRGLVDSPHCRADAFNEIVRRLKDSSRLLIVDEAENLGNPTFNVIRQLYDATGCPVVMAGRPLLHTKISRTMLDPEIGGSLVGRICIQHELEPRATAGDGGRWLFTVDEICAMLNAFKITYTGDAARWLCSLANVASVEGNREGGALRYAMAVVRMAITLSPVPPDPDHPLTRDLLRQANSLLRGAEWAGMADRNVVEFERQVAVG